MDALEQQLSLSVRGQMLSDVPLGAFLSGGIDSSIIVALMQAHSTQPVRTFTIGFDDERYNEAPHAAAIAQQDRKSVVKGQSVSVRVDLGGRRIIKKQQQKQTLYT